MEINGKTQLLGLLGWPVSHSLSPALHNAAAAHHHLNFAYIPLPVHPDHLEMAVRSLPALGFRGVNVTIPHKQAVMAYLDEIDAAAQVIGAVNTIVMSEQWAVNSEQLPVTSDQSPVSSLSVSQSLSSINSKLETQNSKLLYGTNTDWSGFLADLLEWGFDPAERDCLVLGAGGSARAVVYALGQSRGRVHLWARRAEQAETLIRDLSPYLPNSSLTLVSPDGLADCTPALIVNSTPLGMTPHTAASPWPAGLPFPPGALVYDLVYNPAETKLMRDAAAAGCHTRNGLEMLIRQGLQAFQLWTGVEADVEAIKQKWLMAQ